MYKRKINGFISIELVIVAALILSAGTIGVVSLGTNGTAKMEQALNRLDASTIENVSIPDNPATKMNWYDANGYDIELSVNPTNINPVSDFTMSLNTEKDGWIITKYNNTTDKTVVIPKFHTDGLPIIGLGYASLYNMNLTDIVLPNSIETIGELALGGNSTFQSGNNNFSSVYIPESVTNIEDKAFFTSKINKLTFRGAAPTVGVTTITMEITTIGSIRVPAEHYERYYEKYPYSYMIGYNNYWKPVNKPYDGTWYDKELSINVADINPLSDFVFNFDAVNKEYTILDYLNTTDKTVVIPKYYTDGFPIVKLGYASLYRRNLIDIVLPNSIKTIGELALGGDSTFISNNNNFASIYIPESVTTIENKAIFNSRIDKLTFRGEAPTVGTNTITMEITTIGSIRVPAKYYERYYEKYPYSYMVGYNSDWTSVTKSYDGTWYDEELTINAADINPLSDFVLNFDAINKEYTILDYVNTVDKTVIIPKYYTDGFPITAIGFSALYRRSLSDIVLPNSIKTIGELAFGGSTTFTTNNNNFSNVYIPESVINIGDKAFSMSKINKLTFRGAAPTVGANTISMEITTAGSIRVPAEYYENYYQIYPYTYMVGY